MRLLFEVVAFQTDVAKFAGKNGKPESVVPFARIIGLDSDYFDSLIHVKIYRPSNMEHLQDICRKGSRLQIRFQSIKENEFERCMVINAKEADVSAYLARTEKPASQAEPEPVRQMAIAAGE